MICSILCVSFADVPHQNDHSRDPLEQASQIARSGAKLESMRMQVAAENIANMNDTPDPKTRKPYVRKVVFVKRDGILISPKVKRDKKRKAFKKNYNPEHIYANKEGYVAIPNISEEIEKGDLAESRRRYLVNLEVFKVSENIKRSTMGLLK